MTTIAPSQKSPGVVRATVLFWIFSVVATLAILFWILFLVLAFTTSPWFAIASTPWFPLLAAVLTYGILYSWYRMRAEPRLAAVQALNPGAFVAQFESTMILVRQIGQAAPGLGIRPNWNFLSAYGTLVADAGSIRLYRGGKNPIEAVVLPLSRLARVSFVPVPLGLRTVMSLVLEFTDDYNRLWPFFIIPIGYRGVLPKRITDFGAQLQQMQAATSPRQESAAG